MRRFRIVLIPLLLALSIGLGCSLTCQQSCTATAPEETAYLVVMSAYRPELTNLLEEADVDTARVIGETTFHIGTLVDTDVILVLSGIGLERAAATTQTLLDSFQVAGIVFSGIAGGINPDLNIGDVTVPDRWDQADGALDPHHDNFWIPVDATMLEVAAGIADDIELKDITPEGIKLENEPRIITHGNGISNSFFVDDPTYREWLWETFEANAVDMETSAVARVANEHNVPYIAFRSLSDLAGGGPGANEIDTFFQLAADNAATVVIAFLEAWKDHMGH
jgi:adenosylhomocysteine nucleosidase